MPISHRIKITDILEGDAWYNNKDEIIGTTGRLTEPGSLPGAFGFEPDYTVHLSERYEDGSIEYFSISPEQGFYFAKAEKERID